MMKLLVYFVCLFQLVSSAEILPLISRQSNLFEVQGAEGEGADAAYGVAGSSGGALAYYADFFALGCVTTGADVTDLSKSPIFESAEECPIPVTQRKIYTPPYAAKNALTGALHWSWGAKPLEAAKGFDSTPALACY